MKSSVRYVKMRISPYGIGWLHKLNPWTAVACSIALPGLGHFYCGAYLRGFILMSWEILVNMRSRLNLAILLTALGHADVAQTVLNYRWAIIYPSFYLLAMWDSYRLAVEINKLCEVEERQPTRHFEKMYIISWETIFLSKRNPWLALFLSMFLGGAGHFYNFDIVKAVMLMGWHVAILVNSGLSEAIMATLQGNWQEIHTVIDFQWFLFWPSIHLFNMWNAYVDTVELNKLYEEELAYFQKEITCGRASGPAVSDP